MIRHRRLLALFAAFVVLLTACSGGSGTEVGPATTTDIPVVTTGRLASAEELQKHIEDLAAEVEEIRGLQFNGLPTVELVAAADLTPRSAVETSSGDPEEASYEQRFYEMLGVLDSETRIEDVNGPTQAVSAYDPAGDRLLVATSELTPFGRVRIVRELLQALTDQRFDHSRRVAALREAGNHEQAAALAALAEGDAEFYAGIYAERYLSRSEQFAVRLETLQLLEQDAGLGEVPAFFAEAASFPTTAGASFVEELVSGGGSDAVNAAYANPPTTTEQVYHPNRYLEAEAPLPADVPELEVPGYEPFESGSFGELGIRGLLMDGVPSVEALQASTGWGGDAYATWWNGTDVAIVMTYEGDNREEAEQLNSAMLRWALDSLPVGAGRTDNRGIAYQGVDSYAFVANTGTEVLYVGATDPAVGQYLRDKFWPRF